VKIALAKAVEDVQAIPLFEVLKREKKPMKMM
jgi:hypothetical protein